MFAAVFLFATVAAKVAPLDHAACVRALTPPAISSPADLARARPLETSTLKALLVGHVLRDPSRAPPTIYDISYLEWFHEDGMWTHHGGRGGTDSGTYRIEDGKVCVTVGRPVRCRAVWSTARGQYFTVEATAGGGLQVQPVSIEASDTANFARQQPFC